MDKFVRDEVVFLLEKGHAHMTFFDAVKDFPENGMNTVFPNGTYTPWHLLEHIRRTQADILEFMVNSNYEDLEWPQDYWPEKQEKATQKDWDKTIKDYKNDLDALIKIAKGEKVSLNSKIPWGEGQTILRELLVVADHTAYHIGEFAIMRQVLGTWKK